MKFLFQNFTTAGIASILAALCILPIAFYPIASLFRTNSNTVIVSGVALNFIYLVLIIIIFQNLRFLLKERLNYLHLDKLLIAIIVANVIFFFINIALFFENKYHFEYAAVASGAGVLYGVLSIFVGYQFLKIDSDLFGAKKPYAILTICYGICLITVILASMGIILGMAADIVLAIVFFKAAKIDSEQSRTPAGS